MIDRIDSFILWFFIVFFGLLYAAMIGFLVYEATVFLAHVV